MFWFSITENYIAVKVDCLFFFFFLGSLGRVQITTHSNTCIVQIFQITFYDFPINQKSKLC